MSQFDNVSVVKKANVYFDGRCVSHTVLFPDGSRETVGVILPGTLTFTSGAPERMELTGGRCAGRGREGCISSPRLADTPHRKAI